ncbi:MAG: hypothetical protein PUE13_01515 [Clostridiales bacterium]|nr:hypothetical protein [Clostridiales bacterium]
MNLHRIADITVDMGYKYDRLRRQAEAYRISEDIRPDMTIYLSDAFLDEKQKENPHLSVEDCEYIFTSSVYYTGLLHFGGFMLHSSAVLTDGRAYLFSASSGVGKSTHTRLWQKLLGSDRAKILNDDKPAIRISEDGGIYACGTPWSGDSDLNINIKAPIAGICFLEQGEKNKIARVNGGSVISQMLNQTIRPYEEAGMDLLLKHIDKVLNKVPMYKMRCNMSEEAAVMSYREMSKIK